MMQAPAARMGRREFAAVAMLLLALCTKLLLGVQHYLDISGGDDAMYLNLSRNLPGRLMPDFAPLYVVWLKLLVVLSGDPISAYYLNLGCMVLFPALALAFFLYRAGFPAWSTTLFSGLFLCSQVILHLSWNTYVGHLAAGLLLFWLAWSVQSEDPLLVMLTGSIAALIISYARPEFFLAYMTVSGLWVILFVWRKWIGRLSWTRKHTRLLILYITLSLVTMMGIGIPLGQDAWRSWVAIFQHIIYNYALRHDLPYPFMESFNMTEYWKLFAGNSTDLKEIVTRNIPEIKAHLAFNFKEYWRVLSHNLGEVLVPARLFFNIPVWAQWGAILAVIFIGYFTGSRGGRSGTGLLNRLRKHSWLLFTLLVISSPGILFSFLIFPREHYLVAQLPFYLAFILLVLLPQNIVYWQPGKWALPCVAFLLLLLSPRIQEQQYEKIWGNYKKRTLVHDIKAIRELPVFDHKIRLLERETNMAAFLPGNCPVWFPYKEMPFDRFIDSNQVDIILVSEAMRIDRLYKNDPAFQQFTSGAYANDWQKLRVIASGDNIYIRKALLEK